MPGHCDFPLWWLHCTGLVHSLVKCELWKLRLEVEMVARSIRTRLDEVMRIHMKKVRPLYYTSRCRQVMHHCCCAGEPGYRGAVPAHFNAPHQPAVRVQRGKPQVLEHHPHGPHAASVSAACPVPQPRLRHHVAWLPRAGMVLAVATSTGAIPWPWHVLLLPSTKFCGKMIPPS